MPQQPGGERDPGEQPQQKWRCARDSFVRPLALSLHPEVRANLPEGDLDAPARQKPLDDLKEIGPSIGEDQSMCSLSRAAAPDCRKAIVVSGADE